MPKKVGKKSNEIWVEDNNINGKKTALGIFFSLIKKGPEAKIILSKKAKQEII